MKKKEKAKPKALASCLDGNKKFPYLRTTLSLDVVRHFEKMNSLKKISENDFINWVKEFTHGLEKSSVSIIGWEDGTHFEELNKENFGISESDARLFKEKFLGKKLNSKDELLDQIIQFQKKPYLISKNGKYRYDWDLHIWIGNKLIIYNADLKEVEYYHLNFIEKILATGKLPSWIKNESQTKMEN
ncbi:hypothetical protein [Maribacter sp.]|uniref:hypothetical protein n=1 Tax=Maribacter sp. TaxID=1897614 RepID=UPI0025C1D183|nr:hypothetical protein [Maribacter sp.]